MSTFGLIVEGDYDAAAITELIRRCSQGNIDVIPRPCGSKGSLMTRFRGFLEEFRRVKQGAPVDKTLVIRDADARDTQALLDVMNAKIADRRYPFPVKFVIVVRELETWLLADTSTISKAVGQTIPEINDPLEQIIDPKARLKRILLEAKVAYTKEVARSIVASANLERLEYRCPGFRNFLQAVHDC